MVLQYVEKHGVISRAEAAELCHISGPQAYRLLKKLEWKGYLRAIGEKGRGVRYERKSPGNAR
jgi:ATP-dependent DNA helicase RecG